MTPYEKLRISVRYRLLGALMVDDRFRICVDAFNFSEEICIGKFRKDGTTPEFMHPLEVTAYGITMLKNLRHGPETLAALLMHDHMEDAGITYEQLEERFGRLVAHAVLRMSKVRGKVKLSNEAFFSEMLDCPIATGGKGFDRITNQGTMLGVFTPEKQLAQADETEAFILPMVKKARRIFSDQEPVYENIKLVLTNQVKLIRAVNKPQVQAVA